MAVRLIEPCQVVIVAIKIRVLAFQGHFRRPCIECGAVQYFRQLRVGNVLVGDSISDRLVAVEIGLEILGGIPVAHATTAPQVRRAIDLEIAVEVTEVVVVANHGIIPVAGPSVSECRAGTEIKPPAFRSLRGKLLLVLGVIACVAQLKYRFTNTAKVTPLRLGKQSTPMYVLGRQRSVVVRCQIEVIGYRQESAAARIGGAERRIKKACLAAVVNREAGIGPVEHRDITDLKAHMLCRAHTFALVQENVRCHDGPVVVVWGAGGQ